MKVVFIYPDITFYYYPRKIYNTPIYKFLCSNTLIESSGEFYHGLASISAVLKKAGHKTGLLHITTPQEKETLIKHLSSQSPDLVAFSATTNQFNYVKQYSQWVKEELELPTICGGIHATTDPINTIRAAGIDMICVGEGEEAMSELCDKLEEGQDITNIENIWIKEKDRIQVNELRPLLEDLDILPFPDRELFDYKEIVKKEGGIFIAGRGCPYNCSYCCNHLLRKIYKGKGKYVRLRSVENVLDEIQMVLGRYHIKKVNFWDDDLTHNRKWIKEFCEEYKKRFDIPFACNTNPIKLDKELVCMLKNAGCAEIKMGLESGNEYIRKKILRRNISQEQILNAFRLCKDAGIETRSFNMIGIPYEDSNAILDTIKLNAQVKPDYAQVSILYPYPNTDIYDLCNKKTNKEKLLTSKNFQSFFQGSISQQGTDVMFFNRFFISLIIVYSKFYSLPMPLKDISIAFLDKIVTHLPSFYNYLFHANRGCPII